MASVSTDIVKDRKTGQVVMVAAKDPKTGKKIEIPLKRFRVLVYVNGLRKTIHLPGVKSLEKAEDFSNRLEELRLAKENGIPPSKTIVAWLGELPDRMYSKIVKAGLADPRGNVAPPKEHTLGDLLDRFFRERSDAKDSTRTVWENSRRNLEAFFGKEKPLRQITPADADAFRLDLAQAKPATGKGSKKQKPKRLGENTIRKRVSVAKQFFRLAVRSKWIAENPFEDQRRLSIDGCDDREEVLTADEFARVMDQCPDDQWRLIIALSRYGGLRCPSEHLALTWDCVNAERTLLTIRSPKTAHHAGKGERVIPLFDEIRPHLDAVEQTAQAAADASGEPGPPWIITKYRDAGVNLRTQFQKILRRAEVKAWPRLFHAMRATRQTELARALPIHQVCRIMGNSPLIAQRHYLSMAAEDFDAAREAMRQTARNTARYTLERSGNGAKNSAVEPLRNAKNPGKPEFSRGLEWTILDSNDSHKSLENKGNRESGESDGAIDGAVSGQTGNLATLQTAVAADPRILDLLARWPELPPEDRERILEFSTRLDSRSAPPAGSLPLERIEAPT